SRSRGAGNNESRCGYLARVLIDLDFGDHRAVSVVALIQYTRNAAARSNTGPAHAGPGWRSSLPVRGLRCGFHDFDQSRIAQVAQAILDWICLRHRGDLVHE